MDRNMIKSIFSILQVCVLCCLMFLYGSVNASAAVERLSVKGTFLVNEKGESVWAGITGGLAFIMLRL